MINPPNPAGQPVLAVKKENLAPTQHGRQQGFFAVGGGIFGIFFKWHRDCGFAAPGGDGTPKNRADQGGQPFQAPFVTHPVAHIRLMTTDGSNASNRASVIGLHNANTSRDDVAPAR
jgi:hypothetical protein